MTEFAVNTIACVGWGSLVWNPRDLPCNGGWHNDGPLLPVEFARESGAKKNQRGDKITLVICPNSTRVRTYWVMLDVPDLIVARKCLAAREGIPKNWETDIGFADCVSGQTHGLEADTISAWAGANGLTGVVWTNLPCKFNGQHLMPSEVEVIAFLRALDGTKRVDAERYVRNTPRQIETAYRSAIEQSLGWFNCG
ncbi:MULTISPECIES: hypothetical protein [Pseudoxanthomonas]|uniref:Gamma-glutamylcyclotransferase n=1 Tax=Pseudoxanthomonas winnipegensis TaxID=2480810 RepID=A0AAW8GAX6_9GAMM|nr:MULTISPECIES: hypothetical protein [Pseudoxanthomonas]MDQ1119032.1 hypothetical protein [Pseudoxanthomonas winnipegensis]MDQ1132220.1 hypothetical protein [Pseudoxanthomonas winnipegensis]MDR6137766.1 hypothetical protein [Pseudoxanthomonas sp. SORGH_AS_0997]